METLKIGYGRVDITPEGSVPLSGYGNMKHRFNTEVRDPLYATCIAFTDADDYTVLLYTTDVIGCNRDLGDRAREVLGKEYGLDEKQIMIAATHTHSGPAVTQTHVEAIMDFREKYVEGLIEAGRKAMEDRAEGSLYVCGCPTERMNFIRHYKIADGSYAGANFGSWAPGVVGHTSNNDSWMQLIKIVRPGTKDIIMMNWQAHPCFTGGIDKKVLSADYVGDVRKYLEEKTGARFAFFQGAAGNHNGVSFYRRETRTYDSAEYGKLLGDYALWALEAPVSVKSGKIVCLRRDLTLPLDHSDDHKVPLCVDIRRQWRETGDRPACNKRAMEEAGLNSVYAVGEVIDRAERGTEENMPIYAFRVGELGFACAPYEMFGESGMKIKEWAPYAMTFVVSCCNGSRGYLATKLAFHHGSYEVDTRRYPAGTAELLTDNFIEMLKELKK